MLARLSSASLRGLDATAVEVEVDLTRGIPCWSMVGLPEAAVREARDRVRSAVINSGFEFPLRHITVNLSPADIRKDGSYFDLPIAIGLLIASGQLQLDRQSNKQLVLSGSPAVVQNQLLLPFMIGELALDGRLNPVNGVLPLVLYARSHGFSSVLLPKENINEIVAVDGIDFLPAATLLNVVEHLKGSTPIQTPRFDPGRAETPPENMPDMSDVRGQQQARRALEIAASGGHHLLMSGSPGVGKSMLAHRLPGILPPLTMEQALEVTRIYSVSGDHTRAAMSRHPPIRRPHHTASDIAIIGGGSNPRPGEISKADFGILFLDELPTFQYYQHCNQGRQYAA